MKKAVIIYHSKTGRTRSYAEHISKYVRSKNIETVKTDLEDYKDELLKDADYIFLGCWTHGLFVVFQHPDKEWNEFAEKTAGKKGVRLAFFTTYKLLTGSMFNNMRKKLNSKFGEPTLFLKSRNSFLSDKDRIETDRFLNYD